MRVKAKKMKMMNKNKRNSNMKVNSVKTRTIIAKSFPLNLQ